MHSIFNCYRKYLNLHGMFWSVCLLLRSLMLLWMVMRQCGYMFICYMFVLASIKNKLSKKNVDCLSLRRVYFWTRDCLSFLFCFSFRILKTALLKWTYKTHQWSWQSPAHTKVERLICYQRFKNDQLSVLLLETWKTKIYIHWLPRRSDQ